MIKKTPQFGRFSFHQPEITFKRFRICVYKSVPGVNAGNAKEFVNRVVPTQFPEVSVSGPVSVNF